jgi:hypothetical protein
MKKRDLFMFFMGVVGLIAGLLCPAAAGVCMAATPPLEVGVAVDSPVTHQQVSEVTDLLEIDFPKAIRDLSRDIAFLTELTNNIEGAQRTTHSVETGSYESREFSNEDTVLVNSPGGTLLGGVINLKMSKPKEWRMRDIISVPSINGGNSKPLLLRIEAETVSGFTTKVLNPTGTVASPSYPAIAAGTEVLKLAKGIDEWSSNVEGKALMPSARTNYCQTFMDTIKVSNQMLKSKTQVDIPRTYYYKQLLQKYITERELSRLFGQKLLDYDSNGNAIYYSDGVLHMAQNAYPLTAWDNDNYNDMSRSIFDVGVHGSEEKIMLCGAQFLRGLQHVDSYRKVFSNRQVEVVHGVKVKRIETDFGILAVKHNPLMTNQYSNMAFVIDPEYVRLDVFEPYHVNDFDLDKLRQGRGIEITMWETSCVFLENKYAHCVVTGA